MIKSKIVLLSALVSCALISECIHRIYAFFGGAGAPGRYQ